MNYKKIIMKEVYSKMKEKLDKEMHELIVPEASDEDIENQKKMNQELEKTKELRDKLQTEADADDIKRAQDLNKELETTKKHADDLTKASAASPIAEKIAQKVRERLNKEDIEEAKESTADIKQAIKDLVQKLKDQNDHLYPEGAKDLAIDMIKKMDIKEALESMGTADEDTMKYLLQDIGREELVNFEKQFVEMFDTLRDIRYDGSEQLSKGASEISQRIHNFITIFRQAIKGNPVIKEETIDEGLLDQKSPQEIKRMHKTLKDAATLVNDFLYYGTDKQQMLADKIHGTGGMYKLMATLQDELEKREGALDEGKTESLTNNHSNPVTEEFSAGRLKRVQDDLMKLIHKIADKEEIGKKEAIKRAIIALQDAHKGNIYEIISKLG
jgi:hypothetical protein